jgi:predicted acylesterase/phospholipase RssA
MQEMNEQPKRRTIALALPGCGTGAIAVIGMIEELQANGIPIDMIAACSSTSFVAAAYANGTLPVLKRRYIELAEKGFSTMFKLSFDTGLFSLDPVEEEMQNILTVENIEDLNIPIAISTSDLFSGTELSLTMGNISRAIKASCAYPGLCNAIRWGNRILVDGGLFSVIPTETARAFGADIVIAVEMHNQPYIILPIFLKIKHLVNLFKKAIGTRINSIQAFREEYTDQRSFGFFRVLGAAADYAIQEQGKVPEYDCDLLIDFDTGRIKAFELKNLGTLYEEGRMTIRKVLPAIRELIEYGPHEKLVNAHSGLMHNQETQSALTSKESR